VVFARAPVAGAVKTRLAVRLGEEGAARWHAAMTRAAVRTALAARCGRVELHATRRHASFRTLAVPVRLQRGRDLGERMARALRGALRRHARAIVIGADCPALAPADLRRAAQLLRGGCDVVLAPAEDGGYALIGARRLRRALFERIEWGGPHVLAQTRAALRATGLRWRELRTLWDVDRPADLARVNRLRFFAAARR